MTMNAAFVSDERDRDEDEHGDEYDSLFVSREFENPEQPFHSVWHCFGIRYAARLPASIIVTLSVMLSEAKHL
jgi:hypothetical protein